MNNQKQLYVHLLSVIILFSSAQTACAQEGKVVINPIELSYRFQPRDEFPARREAADPVAEYYKGWCYLFASKSGGYWRSRDMASWQYIPAPSISIINDYAPTILIHGDKMYFTASSDGQPTRIFCTETPEDGSSWKEIPCKMSSLHQHDPAFFQDDDGHVYFYWDCSDVNPIMAVEVDPKNDFAMIGSPKELIFHHPAEYGWEQFGINNETHENGWNEGPAMLKVNGKYYLQYASNGTQFRVYCDGCYVSDNPLGSFKYVKDSPFSLKPGGFIGAAGHGHTFRSPDGNYWHVASMLIGQRHRYERRLGLFPVVIDSLGLHAVTALSDRPWYLPTHKLTSIADAESLSCNYTLLSKGCTAKASSSIVGHEPLLATDDSVETWWAAKSGNKGEWLTVDLGRKEVVKAIHLNFADADMQVYTPYNNVVYNYLLEGSVDGKSWFILEDNQSNDTDAPHHLITLNGNNEVRYIKITNESNINGNFSIFDLRVFGGSQKPIRQKITNFTVKRDKQDHRRFTFTWKPVKGVSNYILRWGENKKHLTHAITVTGSSYQAGYFNRDNKYFFELECLD